MAGVVPELQGVFHSCARGLDHPKQGGRSSLLTGKSFLLLTVGFAAYGQLAWSFLLTVEFGLVFLLAVENRFGLFCLRFPPSSKLG